MTMTMTLNRFSRTLGEASRRLRSANERADARREHDEAMLDRGVAQDHAASIARAVADGQPGCAFCS
jgi:hypothetical protein